MLKACGKTMQKNLAIATVYLVQQCLGLHVEAVEVVGSGFGAPHATPVF